MRSKMVFVGVVTIAISVLIGGIVVSASGDEFFRKPKIEEQPTNRSLKIMLHIEFYLVSNRTTAEESMLDCLFR